MKARELKKFLGYAKAYVSRFPSERSQLTFALQNKWIKKYKKFEEDLAENLQEKVEELESKHCIKTETKGFSERDVLVGNQVIFRKNFTPEGEKAKKSELDEYESELLDKNVDVEYYTVPVPADMDISWVNEFTGFVFKEMTPEEEEAWYFNQAPKESKLEILK